MKKIFLVLFCFSLSIYASGDGKSIVGKKSDIGKMESQKEIKQLVNKVTIKKNNTEAPLFFDIVPQKVSYELSKEMPLSNVSSLFGKNSQIVYEIMEGKNENWNAVINVQAGNDVVMQYIITFDKYGSVLTEDTRVFEKQTRFWSFGKEKKNVKLENVQNMYLAVTQEEQPLLGKGKVIRFKKSENDKTELIIADDEIVTTFLQLVVWASTIKTVPDNGIKFRWVINGSPMPVILREINIEKGICYAVFENVLGVDSLNNNDDALNPIAKLVFDEQRNAFVFPNKIELVTNQFSVEFDKN